MLAEHLKMVKTKVNLKREITMIRDDCLKMEDVLNITKKNSKYQQ